MMEIDWSWRTKFRLSWQNPMVLSTLRNTLSGSSSVVMVDKDPSLISQILRVSQNDEKSQQQMPCGRVMGLANRHG
jgi:hypothetical protein